MEYRILGQVIGSVAKMADFRHKWDKDFKKRAAHPFLNFPRAIKKHAQKKQAAK